MTYVEPTVSESYSDGYSAGWNEADWSLFESRRNYSEREVALRDEAAGYTASSDAARRLRAFALGQCRGYRHRMMEASR